MNITQGPQTIPDNEEYISTANSGTKYSTGELFVSMLTTEQMSLISTSFVPIMQ